MTWILGLRAKVRFRAAPDITAPEYLGSESAIAASCTPAKQSLFYHLIGAAEKRERNDKAERFGRLEVDDKLDFSRLLDR